MPISQILILAAVALLIGLLRKGRSLLMLAASVFLVYWLQPRLEDSTLTFWLPAATLALAVLGWIFTASPEVRSWRRNWPAFLILAAVSLLVDLNRWLGFDQFLGTLTPRPVLILIALAALAVTGVALAGRTNWQKPLLTFGLFGLLLLFVLLKLPGLLDMLSGWMQSLQGKDVEGGRLAFSWLGFSYIAFRLLHTFRDRQAGRLPAVTLAEYVTYVIFFPSLSAGPIDRIERFVQDLRSPRPLDAEGWLFAGQRFFIGLFKKFVLADALSWIALNEIYAVQIKPAGWMWLAVYAYAFQIYFDFSGYTDVAIGLARLMGIALPENFAAPYLKSNLGQFWNSWHMTLTQWFRSYYFNPITRSLRSAKKPLPVWVIILFTQVSTMLLIGLWHGIAWNFVLWGLWHGVGMFIQNRWSEFARLRIAPLAATPLRLKALEIGGILLTFHYVALGWVLFVLEPASARHVFAVLFGL